MKPMIRLLVCIGLLAAMPFTNAMAAPPVCDINFVSQNEQVITILPTGINDTANIQCAFELALASGPGQEVDLAEGTFYTAQIVINNFQGSFSGAGAEETVIYNLPNLYVAPGDFYLEPPSAANPWPMLFSFVDGEYQIYDLGIFITGTPTQGWTIFGIDPPIKALATAIGILGTHSDAIVHDIVVEAEPMPSDLNYGYNLYNGVYMEGWIGNPSPPISGSLLIERSAFRNMAYGTPVANLLDASVAIIHNFYTGVLFAMDGSDIEKSTLIFKQNKVSATYGISFYNVAISEITESAFLFRNNQFTGVIGIDFEPILGDGNSCLFQGNNTQRVTDIGIILGTGTHDCKVIGGSPKTSVLDLGTNNILVGVHKLPPSTPKPGK